MAQDLKFADPVQQVAGGSSFRNAATVTTSASPFANAALGFWVNCTAAGSITLTLASGSSVTVPMAVGTFYVPIFATAFTASTGTLTVIALW